MSKGSKQRPRQANRKAFDDNWRRVFGKDPTKKDEARDKYARRVRVVRTGNLTPEESDGG